jgi:hypothetical protein
VYFGVSIIDNGKSLQFGETVMNDNFSTSRDDLARHWAEHYPNSAA